MLQHLVLENWFWHMRIRSHGPRGEAIMKSLKWAMYTCWTRLRHKTVLDSHEWFFFFLFFFSSFSMANPSDNGNAQGSMIMATTSAES